MVSEAVRAPQARPNFNLGRGGGTTQRKPRTKASIATKYLVDREAELRKTHQEALNDWVQTNASEYRTIGEAVRDYFKYFREATVEAEAAYELQIEEIKKDPLLDSVRKAQALSNLANPARAAWTEVHERGWLRTHGDPRSDVTAWNAAVTRQQLETIETWRNGEIVDYIRTPWEIQAPIILENAEWDGSVAPVKMITVTVGEPSEGRLDADEVNGTDAAPTRAPARRPAVKRPTKRPSGRASATAKAQADARVAAEAQGEAEAMEAAEPEQGEIAESAFSAAYETPDGAGPLENDGDEPQTDESAEAEPATAPATE